MTPLARATAGVAAAALVCMLAACSQEPAAQASGDPIRERIDAAKGSGDGPGGIDADFIGRSFAFEGKSMPVDAVIDGLERMISVLEAGVAQTLQQHRQAAGPACTAPRLRWVGDTVVLQRTKVAADGGLAGGVWRDRAVVERCGPDKTYDLLSRFGRGGGGITTVVATDAPGTTIAGTELRQQALALLAPTLPRRDSDCPPTVIADTRFDGFGEVATAQCAPVTDRDCRGWSEAWQIKACGRDVFLSMSFTPDQRGTAIRFVRR